MTAVGTILILAGLIILVLGLIRPRLFHRFGLKPGRWKLAALSLLMLIVGAAVMPTPEPRTEAVVEPEAESLRSPSAEAGTAFNDVVGPAPAKRFFDLTVQEVANALAERKSLFARADGKPDMREFVQDVASDGSSVLRTKGGDLQASFDTTGRLTDVLLISRLIDGDQPSASATVEMGADLATIVPNWKQASSWVHENRDAVWSGEERQATHSGLAITFRRVDPPKFTITVKPDTGAAPAVTPVTMAERIDQFTDMATYCRYAGEDAAISDRISRELGPNASYGLQVGETVTLEQPLQLMPSPRADATFPKVKATWSRDSYHLPAGATFEVAARITETEKLPRGETLAYLIKIAGDVYGFTTPAALAWIDLVDRGRSQHTQRQESMRTPLKAELRDRFRAETGLDFDAVELTKGMAAEWNAKCAGR